MKISVFYDHILDAHRQSGQRLSTILNMVKECGIDGLEIDYTTLCKSRLLPYRIKKAGLKVSCIYEFYNFGEDNDISRAKKHVDKAALMGAGRILVIPGFLPKEEADELNSLSESYEQTSEFMNRNARIGKMKNALTELVKYADARKVTVTLEDFDGNEAPFARINQLLWFMENVEGLKYTFDMGNFAYSDENVESAYKVLSPFIAHVHCKDRGVEEGSKGLNNKGLASVPTGKGYIPVANLIGKLKSAKYNSYLAIEHFDAPDQISYIRSSADFLKKYI